jgi:hypothetical protein
LADDKKIVFDVVEVKFMVCESKVVQFDPSEDPANDHCNPLGEAIA